MLSRFKASQTVDITVPEHVVPIQHYLRQPKRIMSAIADPTRIESLDDDVFRLKMRPLGFMMLSIQPTVDLKLWADQDGGIRLESIQCDLQGVDFINQRFNLELKGRLFPTLVRHKTHLMGRADLAVSVEVPPPLALTPKPILEATGNRLLSGVLLTIKKRLMHQLIADYKAWSFAQQSNLTVSSQDPDLISHPHSTV